jgi:MFS family permease
MTDTPLQDSSARAPRLLGRGYTPAQVRRSLWYVVIAWVFGAAFAALTGGTPITSFLTRYLKADDFSYGLIMAVGPAAVLFQFIGSYIAERTGRVKRNFIIFCTLHRLLWLAVAAIPLLMGVVTGRHPDMRVVMVGVLIFLSGAIANLGGAGWTTWMADIVPGSLAGKFFGLRARLGMLSMIVVTLGAAKLLDLYHDPWVYVLIFGLAGVLGAVDILLFIPVPENPRPVEPEPPSMLEILVTPWRDPLFRGFALYLSVAWIAYFLMGPFVWRYCIETPAAHGLGLPMSLMNLLLFIIPTLGMAWVSPMWGNMVDRFGPKPVMLASSLAAFVIPCVWLFVHPGTTWLIWIACILSGLTWPGIDQTLIFMQVKGFPDTRRSTYNAALQVVLGVASTVGTALGGLLAAFWHRHLYQDAIFHGLPSWVSHYHPVFIASLVLRLAAIVFFLARLPLPGAAGQRTVYRSLAGNLSTSITKTATAVVKRGRKPDTK